MKKRHIILAAMPLILFSCSSGGTVSTESSVNSEISIQVPAEDDSPQEELTIRMAVFGDGYYGYDKYVEDFNNADNGYRLETVNYRAFTDESEKDPLMGMAVADMQLNQDIIKGNVVDIVCNFSFSNPGYYDIMEKKGAFIDLRKLMESDTDFDRAELNEYILSLYEIDGELYRLPTFYEVNTMLGTKKYVGDRENWTIDELIDCYNKAPDNAAIDMNHDSLHVFLSILRNDLSSFVDYKNGTCSFNDPEFIKALEFCGNFNKWSGVANDVDRDAPQFAVTKRFYSFKDYHFTMWNYRQRGEECTFVGYPSEDGCGSYVACSDLCFSICSSSSDAVKQGAWEFIKNIVSEGVQNEKLELHEYDETGFPINEKSFEKMLSASMGTGENIISIQGDEYDIGHVTEEESTALISYINSTQRVETRAYTQLYRIIEDEVINYFNGERTAEETADLIQNRASIMISEMM